MCEPLEGKACDDPAKRDITLLIKFQGQDLNVHASATDTVASVKRQLEDKTRVLAKKQKLLGLKTCQGRPPTDDTAVGDLRSGSKILLMGTPEEMHQAIAAQEVAPHVQVHDDLDDDLDNMPRSVQQLLNRPEIQQKLQRRTQAAVIKQLHAPRLGKKCAVFDIDYTIFALDSKSENPLELARPYVHELFAGIYPHFDIIIWSATSMKWIDTKLREIGVSNHSEYKITACMDYTAMVTVDNVPGMQGHRRVFDCKPLKVLWDRYPTFYNPSNTIMIDDLRRNYCLNPQVSRPYSRGVNLHISRSCGISHDDLMLMPSFSFLHISCRMVWSFVLSKGR